MFTDKEGPPTTGTGARGPILLAVLVLACSAGLASLIVWSGARQGSPGGVEVPSHLRAAANKLSAAGLHEEAARLYERYLDALPREAPGRSGLAFTIGDLYSQAGVHAKALASFYLAEALGPDENLRQELGGRIVASLERLGRHAAAEYDLRGRTHRGGQPQGASPIVATIGEEHFTLGDLDRAIADLPPWFRQRLERREDKVAYLSRFVAEELFHRKALKLQYDKAEDVADKVQRYLRQVLVEKVVETEVAAKVAPTDLDLTTYFKAHSEDYRLPDKLRLRGMRVPAKAKAELESALGGGASLTVLAARLGGTPIEERWLERGSSDLGLDDARGAEAKLFALPSGGRSEPLAAGQELLVLEVLEKVSGREVTFAEARSKVENDLRTKKLQEGYDQLLRQTLAVTEVTLHPEAIP